MNVKLKMLALALSGFLAFSCANDDSSLEGSSNSENVTMTKEESDPLYSTVVVTDGKTYPGLYNDSPKNCTYSGGVCMMKSPTIPGPGPTLPPGPIGPIGPALPCDVIFDVDCKEADHYSFHLRRGFCRYDPFCDKFLNFDLKDYIRLYEKHFFPHLKDKLDVKELLSFRESLKFSDEGILVSWDMPLLRKGSGGKFEITLKTIVREFDNNVSRIIIVNAETNVEEIVNY